MNLRTQAVRDGAWQGRVENTITGLASERMLAAEFISNDFSVFHHEPYLFQFGHVFSWVAGSGDYVGELPSLDRSNAILPAQQLRGVRRCRPDDLPGRHARSAIRFKGERTA